MPITIHTVLEPYGPATAIQLTTAQVTDLGGGKRAPVIVSIAGRSARLRIAAMGGDFVIGISKANRAALGVDIGDSITATIALDEEVRTVEVPPALQAALAASPDLQAAFDALPYTLRKEHALTVADAKRDETRERRIAKIVTSLVGS